ncbi:DUF2069 domain-containing protein [Denitrificimonas sp. JX-1]|uniref:DUF2069 domain-containing protein n=1 Tax=Denitrificimonas halotolerans TaxID=3098930 RepID=A0ABU5GNX2_9GAMM|nr:DUF2069 domain-containing protein [Denitrificimonas sp. JX-1]MDY7218651.1 DUF2069 domain-containing protein [Denitrificimonas sp. JX-1]
MAKKNDKPLPELNWLKPRLRISRLISLVSLAALAALLVVWNLFFINRPDTPGLGAAAIITIALTPLMIVALGMLLGSEKTHIWACILINIYFIHGVVASFSPVNAWLGYTETFLSVLLFCSAFMHTLWSFKYKRKLAGEA